MVRIVFRYSFNVDGGDKQSFARVHDVIFNDGDTARISFSLLQDDIVEATIIDSSIKPIEEVCIFIVYLRICVPLQPCNIQ